MVAERAGLELAVYWERVAVLKAVGVEGGLREDSCSYPILPQVHCSGERVKTKEKQAFQ